MKNLNLRKVQIEKRKVVFFLVVALSWVLTYSVMSPWRTVKEIHDAILEENVAELNKLIDFKSVRSSLESQLKNWAQNRIANYTASTLDVGGALLGSFVLAAQAEQLLNQVSAEGIISMNEKREDGITYSVAGLLEDYDLDYVGLNEVRIKVTNSDGDVGYVFMKRTGFGSWKVYRVYIPALNKRA